MPNITLGTGIVWRKGEPRLTFTLYKTDSALNHSGTGIDDLRLKTELTWALNLPDSQKVDQGGGKFKAWINDGKGYLVYQKDVNNIPNTAVIFHFHWNYNLDRPLPGLE